MTVMAGSDVVQSGRPIFDDFFQHLRPYIGKNTVNGVFQMIKQSELIVDYDTARQSFLRRESDLNATNARLEIFRKRDRQLDNDFNQIHAFEVLNQEESEMAEQHITDDEFLIVGRAMNVGQKDAFLFITRSISGELNNQIDERHRLSIMANAETGKTFLFNLLKNR
ncbi:ATP-dependent DNA helicase [Trichonephila clavipes]|nr:ATP-dependent DNA helicase [Trichonephila clavipes]